MILEVKVNELPESVADGTIVSWHKQPGAQVNAGDPLAEVETDKVVLELSAPTTGVLGPHLRKKGDTVKRGDVITTIDESGAVAGKPAPAPGKPEPVAKTAPVAKPAPAPVKKAVAAPAAPPPPTAVPPAPERDDEAGLSPAVRRLLDEHKLDPADVIGTGPRGRITKEDVVRHLEHS